jgi:thiamine biosynthesis lipoprotein
MRISRPYALALALACAAALCGAGCRDPSPRRIDIAVGDSPGSLTLPPDLAGRMSAAAEIVMNQFRLTASELNPEDPRSDIAKVNRVAGAYRQYVSFNTFRAIDLAHYYSRLTGGAYDLTVMPALEAWGFAGPVPETPPDDEECAALQELIGPHRIHLPEQGAVSLLTPGVRIAPEGLVHAYGVDLAIVEMRRQEIDRALVTWDRYARALGRFDAQTPWRHPVRNPFGSTPLGDIALDGAPAVAIIGLRDRTVTIQGRTYGGVIDPRSARPAEGVALAAVRAPTCIMAHALAHALIVLGLHEGALVLAEFPECDALLVRDTQPIEAHATAGWIDAFAPSPLIAGAIREWKRHAPFAPPDEPTDVSE